MPALDEDPFWRLTAAFLVDGPRPQTRRAYFTDLKAWCAWCIDRHATYSFAAWLRRTSQRP